MVHTIFPKCNNLRCQSCWRCAWWPMTKNGYRLNCWNRVLVDGPVLRHRLHFRASVMEGRPPLRHFTEGNAAARHQFVVKYLLSLFGCRPCLQENFAITSAWNICPESGVLAKGCLHHGSNLSLRGPDLLAFFFLASSFERT